MTKPRFTGEGVVGQPSEYTIGQQYRTRAAALVSALDPDRVLEIGPYGCPLFDPEDTLDNEVWFGLKPTYLMDARDLPWPIDDDSYDVVVALQVFEHLWPDQGVIFRECLRVAPTLVVSVPHLWPAMPSDPDHEDIDEQTVRGWFGRYPDHDETFLDRTYITISDDPTPRWGRYLAVYHRGEAWRGVRR